MTADAISAAGSPSAPIRGHGARRRAYRLAPFIFRRMRTWHSGGAYRSERLCFGETAFEDVLTSGSVRTASARQCAHQIDQHPEGVCPDTDSPPACAANIATDARTCRRSRWPPPHGASNPAGIARRHQTSGAPKRPAPRNVRQHRRGTGNLPVVQRLHRAPIKQRTAALSCHARPADVAVHGCGRIQDQAA